MRLAIGGLLVVGGVVFGGCHLLTGYDSGDWVDGQPADGAVAPDVSSDHDAAIDTVHQPDGTADAAPDSVTPDSMAPDSMAPDSMAPDSMAPDSMAPDSMAPDSMAPDSMAPDSMAPDSMAPDSMAPDLGPPAVPTFNPPVELSSVNVDGEDGPHLSSDGLRLYFGSTRSGGLGQKDIWMASRSNTSSFNFTNATPLAVINSVDDDADCSLSADELTIVFERKIGNAQQDLWQATRSSTSASFGAPVLLTGLNSAYADEDPTLSPDGLKVIFGSDRPSGGDNDLWIAARGAIGQPFGTPTRLAVSSPDNDSDPGWSSGFFLLFESDRPGSVGNKDIFIAVGTAAGPPFGTALSLGAVNSTKDDEDPFLHHSLGLLIFQSSRKSGPTKLYYATYAP